MSLKNCDYVSSISLMLVGESLDPSAVSRALNLVPDKCWSRGDPKEFGESRHQWGGWRQNLPEPMCNEPFEAQLRYWTQRLQPKVCVFQEFSEAGVRCVLDCFLTTSDAAFIAISPQLQREFSALGLELEFSIWGGVNEG